MKIDRVRIGDKIPGCSCGKGEVKTIDLTRDKQAYVVSCKCGVVYYISVTGRLE